MLRGVAAVRAKNLLNSQRIGTPVQKDDKTEDMEELRQCVASMHERDWRAAHAQRVHDVHNEVPQKGIVPNPKQWEMPNVAHHRCRGMGDTQRRPP